jgi:hypothetical protein
MSIYSRLIKFYLAINLDKNEKFFIKKNLKKNSYNFLKKNYLFQLPTDYYYLCYYKIFIKENFLENKNLYGLWPYIIHYQGKKSIFTSFFKKIYLKIYDYFIKKKWSILYSSIGIKKIFDLSNDNKLERKICKYRSIRVMSSLKSKSDLLKVNFLGINIGDLIYDSYLRYRGNADLDIKDNYLRYIIYKSFLAVFKIKRLMKDYKFNLFHTSYTSYINHGVPVRFLVKKKGITILSGKEISHYNKRVTKKDLLDIADYKNFKKKFIKLENKKNKVRIGLNTFDKKFKKFSNNLGTELFFDTYKADEIDLNNFKIIKNVNGVVFLHDFFDANHAVGKSIFADYYEWTIFTLNCIKRFNLKIAIKPHPNTFFNKKDSVLTYKELKKNFSDLLWLDYKFPNSVLFKKIKFGVSVQGSVLGELAYHNIPSISCGDNPAVKFNLSYKAKSIKDYKDLLLNGEKLKVKHTKNDLGSYIYMYYLYQKDAYPTLSRKINLKTIPFQDNLRLLSSGLIKFENLYRKHI